MKIGKIESIWRYPVKGMKGEQVDHIYAGYAGLMGDRIYGVIAKDGDPAFPWHTGRDQEEFVLYKPTFQSDKDLLLPDGLDAFEALAPGINPVYPEAEDFRVEVETPEGKKFDIEDPAFIEDLQATTERELRVHLTQKGQHDCRPISLFSLSAAAKLSEELGMAIDKRRFRANFYVEWDDTEDPYKEFSLVGKSLKIGDKLEVKVIERDPRCKMITLDPDTSEESPRILQHVSRAHGGDAGVFAAVLKEGRVKAGDPISII
jgi:uncharacterized protein YcbX